jgi:methyl-accepting chemotaxis protein
MNEEQLRIVIRAEMEEFKNAMKQAVSALQNIGREGKKASGEIDDFTSKVNNQAKELQDLKRKYVDIVANQGEWSEEAIDCAAAIMKLSKELKENKGRIAEINNIANTFDATIEQIKQETATFTQTVQAQAKELQDLKQEYIDIAATQGKESDAAKDLENRIRALSEQYKKHKQIVDGLSDDADSFDVNIGPKDDGSKKDLEDTAGKVDEIGNAINGVRSMNFGDVLFEGLGEAVRGAFKDVKSFAEGAKKAGAAIKTALKGVLGVVLVIIADLAILIGLVNNAINVAKKLKEETDLAMKAGMDTNSYKEWGYVLKQVGIEADKVADFTKKMAEKQNELRDGSESTAKAFEAIGISADEAMGMDRAELLDKTVKGLQNVESETERTSLAYRIFTDDAADLNNVLQLTNSETESLISNFYNLGAAPSENLIQQSSILESSTTNLSYAWQGLTNTLAEWVIPAVSKVVQWITIAIAYINVFLQGVFGIEAGTKKAAKETEKGLNGQKKKYKDTVDAIKRYTMGFDELNLVQDQSKGGNSQPNPDAFSGGGLKTDVPVIEIPDMSKFRTFMDEYGSIIQGILTWSLMGIGVLLAVIGFMHGNIAMGILGISIAGLGIGVGAAGEENHWSKLGEAIKNAWDGIVNWFKQYVAPIFTKEWWAEKWNNIKNATAEKLAELKAKIDEKIEPIKQWFNDKVKPIFTKQYWIDLWENIKTAFSDKLTEIKTKIDEKMKPIKDWFNNKVKPLFTKDYWKQKWDNIKNAASEKVSEIKAKIDEKLKPLKDWFNNSLKPIFTKDFWQGKWNTVKDGAKGAFNGVIEIVEKAINWIIKQINKLSWDVPEWVPLIGGQKWGFDFKTISIPRLAEGGIATKSTLANIGERGREAVLPLENNTGWMDILADRVASRNAAPSKIVLMVGERELGYAAINSINGITQQTGQLQLALY